MSSISVTVLSFTPSLLNTLCKKADEFILNYNAALQSGFLVKFIPVSAPVRFIECQKESAKQIRGAAVYDIKEDARGIYFPVKLELSEKSERESKRGIFIKAYCGIKINSADFNVSDFFEKTARDNQEAFNGEARAFLDWDTGENLITNISSVRICRAEFDKSSWQFFDEIWISLK